MRRPKAAFMRLIGLRHSPNLRVRTAFWVSAAVICGTALLSPQPRAALLAVWITWNIFYTSTAVFWSLFHVRAILRARDAGLSWTVWLTLVSTLLVFSNLYARSMEWQGPASLGSNVTTPLVAVVTVLICPLLFLTILGIGWIGAAVGAFSARRSGDIEAAARAVVKTAFAEVALMSLSAGLGRGTGTLYLLCFLSLPVLTVGFYRLPQQITGPASDRLRLITHILERGLQWRITLRSRRHRVDARGVATGLFAASLILATPAPLIVPFKTLGLVTLIHAKSAASTFFSVLGVRFNGNKALSLDPKLVASRSRIVILDMDATVRESILNTHQALTSSAAPPKAGAGVTVYTPANSESRVQSQVIERLVQWNAARVVLPTPTLHESSYWPVPGQPAPDRTEIDRTRADTRLLAATMQAAGNVVLMLPPNRDRLTGRTTQDVAPETVFLNDDKQQRLIQAAHAVGLSDPSWSSTAHLPMVPAHWHHYVPVPVLLSAEQTGRTIDLQPTAREFDLSRIAGIHLPQIAPEGVLINFVGDGPQHDFVHIPYSTLLKNEPFYLDEPGETPGWTTPGEHLRGHTVFLDSLSSTMHPTPIGAMPRPEIMAYGTATLLSGDSIRRINPLTLIVLTLIMGAIMGISGFRRAPIEALWRAAIPLFAAAILSLALFIMRSVWLDPIQPLGAGLLALGFVSQFTFSKERAERERTRALFQRFVAPQTVDELLSRPGETLGLGGKRQTVCVLFADVRNFTGFTERNEADKVIEVINIYMGALTEALHHYGGVLDKFTGDGLMAWFPVGPNARVDVGRAVNACLEMRDSALKVSEQMPPAERLDLGFGMHYGDAVIGLVGCEALQVNWTALGYTVVVSARLQTIAAGGEVVISEQIHRITAGAFNVTEGEPVKVKGLTTPVRPYRVISSVHKVDPITALPAAPIPQIEEQNVRR